MAATVLADPGIEIRDGGRRRYALPALLVLGWGGLFAYCAAYLTEDMPFRTPPARGVEAAPGLRSEDLPRRVIVVAAPEPPAADAVPAIAVPAVAAVSAPPAPVAPPAAVPAVAPATPRPAPAGAEYVGTWGPTADACGARSHRRGYLPATITPERARAGRTICSFRDGRRTGNAWVMAAECSDRGRRWSSQVRLVVDGDRLTWTSAKGTSAYVRCNRRAG